MNDLLAEMATLRWWIGVVLVGIIINIISRPIGKWSDSIFGLISKQYRARNEKAKQERDKYIEFLRKNPSEKYIITLEELRDRIRAITYFIFSLLLLALSDEIPLLIARLFALIFGLCIVILGLYAHSSAMKKLSLFYEVYKKDIS